MKWIATAYDSDEGFAVGECPEEAQEAYIEKFGVPRFGFSVIQNREDYKRELVRVSQSMGYTEGSIMMIDADKWIVVVRLTDSAEASLERCESASHLLNDWSSADGDFFITARPPLPRGETREERRQRLANIVSINGINPSERQKEWAARFYSDWPSRMAWAHKKQEIKLTETEIAYVQERRKEAGWGAAAVDEVYRWEE
ncbi:MAG: hypothetical protein LBD10_14635 [Desulfobulbus sp.]|uniref:hypothetical protein n=1 Tax=Desulfobulbus sp. TaxID=895 RepID=UPI0028476024|nr:hypothetical protein [Desulfobulbus sp.]MDR2551424.1 hypothetical protein [Desulfobulbus sp.]